MVATADIARAAHTRTRIKICGLTRSADVHLAVALGADAVGFVFAPGGLRCLSLDAAERLRARVPPLVSVVALLRNQPRQDIARIVAALQPDLLQFHGDETQADCEGHGRPWLKAIALGGSGHDAASAWRAWPNAAGYVFDGHAPGTAGGSGERFDWSRAPSEVGKPWLLAGGLTPANVGEAIALARPWAVDVSSGVESAPGVKDHHALRAFFAAVAAADAGATMPPVLPLIR